MPPHGVCYSLWTVVVTLLLMQVFCHIVLQVAIIHLYNKPTFLPVCTDKFQPLSCDEKVFISGACIHRQVGGRSFAASSV